MENKLWKKIHGTRKIQNISNFLKLFQSLLYEKFRKTWSSCIYADYSLTLLNICHELIFQNSFNQYPLKFNSWSRHFLVFIIGSWKSISTFIFILMLLIEKKVKSFSITDPGTIMFWRKRVDRLVNWDGIDQTFIKLIDNDYKLHALFLSNFK